MRQNDHFRALARRLRKARKPRGLTLFTQHSRSVGKLPRCSSTNRNPLAVCVANPCRAAPSRLLAREEWVAFFRISISSRGMRFSRRRRSFSSASSRSLGGTTSVSRCAVIHLFSVYIPTPRSSAICLRESPPVSAIRTASLRNSPVLTVPIAHPLCCTLRDQRSGTKA